MDFANEHNYTAREFRRVESPPPVRQMGTDGASDLYPSCVACKQHHVPGSCPLRRVGYEFCGLCGVAHFSSRRVCPHLQSSVQVERMLAALKASKEDSILVNSAYTYLFGVLSSTAQTKRNRAARLARHQLAVTSASPHPNVGPQIVDVTGGEHCSQW
jgi:hypothetical protein